MRSSFVELIAEILVGIALIGVGFGVLYAMRGEAAFAESANHAWTIGAIVVGGGGIGFLVMREWLVKRNKR